MSFRKSVCLSLLTGSAKREADEWRDGLIAQHTGERFTLSLGEKAGVSVGLTFSGNARRELEKKNGRKVVTSENYRALTQAVKRVKLINTDRECRT